MSWSGRHQPSAEIALLAASGLAFTVPHDSQVTSVPCDVARRMA